MSTTLHYIREATIGPHLVTSEPSLLLETFILGWNPLPPDHPEDCMAALIISRCCKNRESIVVYPTLSEKEAMEQCEPFTGWATVGYSPAFSGHESGSLSFVTHVGSEV